MRNGAAEPLDEVAVRIPDEHLGAVLGDLSGRRGRVLGTEVGGLGPNRRPSRGPLHRAASLCGGPAAMTSGAARFTRPSPLRRRDGVTERSTGGGRCGGSVGRVRRRPVASLWTPVFVAAFGTDCRPRCC